MFERFYNTDDVRKVMLPAKTFQLFPKCGEETGLSQEHQQALIARGEEFLGYTWEPLRASMYLEYVVNGNRTHYEEAKDRRRFALAALMNAEWVEAKGRFMKDLVDVLYATLEEMTWVVPAHNEVGGYRYSQWGRMVVPGDHKTMGLPDPDGAMLLDLFSAATGAEVATVYGLFYEQLNAIADTLPRMVEIKLDERILTPFLDNYYWWAGLDHVTNNWNPWIVENVLTVAAMVCKDDDRRARIIARAALLLDNFLKGYHPDGGCDEGPGYWGVAGACLFNALDLLSKMTDGAFEYAFEEPLVQNIGKYIYRAFIGGSYFTNYADATQKVSVNPILVYRYGKRIHDENMMVFGAKKMEFALRSDFIASEAKGNRKGLKVTENVHQYYAQMTGMIYRKEVEAVADKGELPLLQSVWMDGIQVMCERVRANDEKALFLSAKAGTNDESHNHNDVGTFLLYYRSEPIIADIGAGTYTAKTFSSLRYTIPQMQSSYHNLPDINGVAQADGEGYQASDVSYVRADGVTRFSQNIATAYPKECGATRWQRTFEFDSNRSEVRLTDAATFEKAENTADWNLITPFVPKLAATSVLFCPETDHAVRMTLPEACTATVDYVDFENDPKLERNWDAKGVYRLRIRKVLGRQETVSFTFHPEN